MELVLHPEKTRGLRLLEARDWDARPAADYEGNLLLAKHRTERLSPLLPLLLFAPNVTLELTLLVPERCGALEVLIAYSCFLVRVHLLELILELSDLRRRRLRREPRPGTCLIDHV